MKRIAKISLAIATGAFAAGYFYGASLSQPLSSISKRFTKPVTVNRDVRIEHAKELFGKHYQTSVVRRAERAQGVTEYIHARVEDGLPEKWKDRAQDITQAIIHEANSHSMDPLFVLAVITRESRLNPDVRGRHGEIGLMQLKPDTAAWIANKAKMGWRGARTLEDPVENVKLGVAYLDILRKRYDRHSLYYISAYNMGPRRLNQLVKEDTQPKEYAGRVMHIYSGLYRDLIRRNVRRTQDGASYGLWGA